MEVTAGGGLGGLGGGARAQKEHDRHLQRSQWKRANLAWQNGKHLASIESPLKVDVHAAPSSRPSVTLTEARGEGAEGGGLSLRPA